MALVAISITLIAFALQSSDNGASGVDLACSRLAAAVPQGTELTEQDVLAVTCSDEVIANLRYSRNTGRVLAGEALMAGDYLGRVKLGSRQAIKRGQQVRLNVTLNGVTISRSVIALEDFNGAAHAFVETPEGNAISVPVDGAHIRVEAIR